jgi:hypothetical protein
MRPAETIASLDAFPRRGAGTDAERRAAVWLRDALDGTRVAHLEPFWCRPNWALAHAWHLAGGVAGSLITRASPRVGGAIILVALLSTLADALTGRSLGRLLTRERASQNVVSEPGDQEAIHLVITANYDAGRCGLIYRSWPRRAAASLARVASCRTPGWLAWMCLALVCLLVVALLRLEGDGGLGLDLVQLFPTVVLVIATALLLEQATSDWSPAAGDNASGVAAAIALVRALDAAPPGHLAVDLVLQGASDGDGTGLRHYLRARRRQRQTANTVVLGFAPCGAGQPRWWLSDGNLVPVGYFGELRRLCAAVAREDTDAMPYRGRGRAPALPARSARLPAIALGCLDPNGLAPRSHQPTDTPARVDPAAVDKAVEFALLLVDRIDEFLAGRGAPAPTRTTQA